MIHAHFLTGLASHLSTHYTFVSHHTLRHVCRHGDAHIFTLTTQNNKYTVRWLPIGMTSYRLEEALPVWDAVARVDKCLPALVATGDKALVSVYGLGICVVHAYQEIDWYLPQMDEKIVRQIADLHALRPQVAISTEMFEMPYADTYLSRLREALGRPFAEPIQRQMRNLLDSHHEGLQFLWRRFRVLEAQCQLGNSDFVLTHGNPLASVAPLMSNGQLTFTDGDSLMLAPPERDLWRGLLAPQREQVIRWYRATMPHYTVDDSVCQYYALRDYFEQVDYWVDTVLYASDERPQLHDLDALQAVFDIALPLVARV